MRKAHDIHHVRLYRVAFTISGILLGLAARGGFGLQRGDVSFALRLIPAFFLGPRRPFIGGGVFPPSLRGPGVGAVYVVPGPVFLVMAVWWRARKRAAD